MILNFSILHGRFVSTSQIENQLQVLISHAREWQKSETLRTLVQTRMRTRLSAKGKKKMQRLKRLAAIFLLQYYAALIHANEVPMNVQKTPCSSTWLTHISTHPSTRRNQARKTGKLKKCNKIFDSSCILLSKLSSLSLVSWMQSKDN